MSAVTYSDAGELAFDTTLTNNGEETLFGPINFTIVSISDADVSVSNADNGGSGQSGNAASFIYDQGLAAGNDSDARRMMFDNVEFGFFTFEATVSASIAGQSVAANGSQAPVDTSAGADRTVVYHHITEHDGIVLVGTTDIEVVEGVDYVDVDFTAKDSAQSVVATLSAETEVGGAVPDLDFSMLDADGNVLATSGNLGASEEVGSTVVGGEDYILRVKGYANVATQFTVVLDQMVSAEVDSNAAPATSSDTVVPAVMAMELVEFRVDPVNGTITRVNTSEVVEEAVVEAVVVEAAVVEAAVVEAAVVEAAVAPVNGASFTL
jgi:hypothetical protein